MEYEFNLTLYKRRLDKLFRACAPHSLNAVKEVLRRHLQDGVRENSKTPSEVLGSMEYSTTKSSGACQTRAHGTAHTAYILQDKGWDIAHALHQL
jgi:hypothetical protein